jgi:flagellar protein FliO/FliZ
MDMNAAGVAGGDFSVWRALSSLALILGMMLAVYYWLRRRGGVPGASTRRMKVIERMPIDARRSLMLVRVDDRDVLIGLSHEQITLLQVTEKQVPDEA